MSNLENLKHTVEELKRESAEATHNLAEKEDKLHKDEQEIATLKTKIPHDEKELMDEKQVLRKDELERDKLAPEVRLLKRKQAEIHNKTAEIVKEENEALRSMNARDHGKQIKELQHKSTSW